MRPAWTLVALACGASGCGAPAEPGPLQAEAGAPIVGYVGEPVTFDASASTGASRYEWSFGEPDAAPAIGTTAAATHTYAAPGHYDVFLTVRDGAGRSDTDAVVATIVYPPLPFRASASATVDADEDGARLFVVMPDFDRVAVVDRAAATVTHLDTCAHPVALSHARALPYLAVACRESDELEVFDTAALASVGRAALPRASRPAGVVVVPDQAAAYLALAATGEVAEVRWDGPIPPTPALARRVAALPDPRAIALAEDAVVVARFRSPDDAGEWTWLPLPDLAPAERHALPFDEVVDSDTHSRGVPNFLLQIVPSPDGRTAVVPSLQSNIARGLVTDGQTLTFETTVRGVASVVALAPDPTASLGDQLARKVFDNRDLASCAAFSPLGDYLYVGTYGAETVEVLDAFTRDTAGAFLGVGHGVDGVWVSPDGAELWVSAGLDRTLVAYSVTDLSASPQELLRLDLTPPSGEALAADVLLGQRLFAAAGDTRMSEDGYLSCASCHFDGEHDGRTWDFTQLGEGVRNTISLAGGAGVPPLHWSANFDEVQDFENAIRAIPAGTGLMGDGLYAATMDPLGPAKAGLDPDLDALAAYVQSLARTPRSPFRTPAGAHTSEAAAGEALFLSARTGCAGCHVPPAYTDSRWLAPGEPLLHDVGTLTPASGMRLGGPLVGLDTPSLRGAWATAPYLHDGSAPTLRDVLVAHNRGDLHGHTSSLTPEEIDALVAFLLQIE
ncbi:MAG TPA: PKD domain-containing protein [Myxococcota bacterium]|nr:PKD domain-containing protein [Myxococcota bacterium]